MRNTTDDTAIQYPVELDTSKSKDAGDAQNQSRTGDMVQGVAEPPAPKIILARELLPVIHEFISSNIRAHGEETETGGMLVGEFKFDEGGPVFTIRGFIGAGPNADLSPESVLFDADYQQSMLKLIHLQHPRSGNMGCIHVHPGLMDVCSEGDWVADVAAVQASDTKTLVFAIITINHPGTDPLSVFYRNLKIDFFVLAAQNGFEYFHVRPSLHDLPLVQPARALREMAEHYGPGLAADLVALRRLPGVAQLSVQILEEQDGAALVSARLKRPLTGKLHMLLREGRPVDVCITWPDRSTLALPGPWAESEGEGGLVLAGVAEAVLRQPGILNAAARHSRHHMWRPSLLSDKKRLVAEVRAVEERYGGRATLKLEGSRLFWEYTVVESGRRFPIEVRYPRRYPLEPPRIFSMLPLPCSPHQMQGNELCWTNRFAQVEWNPARDTAATCITAAHRWFACLLVYLTFGKWPTEADDEPNPHT